MRSHLLSRRNMLCWLALIAAGVLASSGLTASADKVRQECMRNGAVVESTYPTLMWDKESHLPGWHIVCRYYYFDDNSDPVTWTVGYVYSLSGKGLGITQPPQRDG